MNVAVQIARHWPFANGSGRIIDRYARDVDLGTGERLAATSDGFDMRVIADDLIGRHILLTGGFDRSVVQVLLDQARAGDVLLDIGANIGYVACVFLQKVPASSAICVEPQPQVVDLLIDNLARFPGRAQVAKIALSDREGTAPFQVDGRNRGASRLVGAASEATILVPQVSSHTYLGQLERVDLIKIDVEGWEEPILRSMEEQLTRLRPRAVMFEDHNQKAADEGPIGSVLRRTGYRVFGVSKRLLRTDLVPIKSETDCRYNDYIALLG